MPQIPIDADMEKFLVESVIEDYKNAETARENKKYGKDNNGVEFTYDTKNKKLNDIYYGNREPKSVPWKNCSNRSMKIAMAIVEMLHARMFPATWNEDLIRWRPGERNDKKNVDRINKLMDWWIRVHTKMRNFFDKWTKLEIAYGDVLVEGAWEVETYDKGDVTETPITDEFGIQLYEKNGSPSVSRQKKFRTEERTRVDIIPRANVFLQEGQTELNKSPVVIKQKWTFSDLETMENEGKAVNINEPLHESKTLRQLYMERLDASCSSSNLQNVETMKEVKLQSTTIDVIKCYKKIDIDRDGFQEDIRIIVDPLNRIYLGGVYVKDITKSGKRPLCFTKINDLLDTPDILEGYGYLEMVLPLAEEIDAIFNQITDSNTLSVLRPFFYDNGGSLIPQNITLAPNKGIPVPDPQRNVFIPDIQIPTERLMLALRGVLEFIERLTGASSYVMGKESEVVGGSGTATRTQAIVSAAEQRFAIPAERLRTGAAKILTIVLDLLQKNIPPGLETRILGEDDEPIFKGNELTEEGITGEYDAYLLEDAAMGSMDVQRQLAVFLYQTLMQNPLVATDPVKIYRETANLLRSFREDPEEHLGPEPDEKDTDTPEDENTLMVQGQFSRVQPILTENHFEHIMKHQQLMESPTMFILSPEEAQIIAQFNQMHIQQHMMMLQQLMMLQSKFGAGAGGKGGQSGTGGSAQGVNQQQGMAGISGPFGAVEKRKEEGTSGTATPLQ